MFEYIQRAHIAYIDHVKAITDHVFHILREKKTLFLGEIPPMSQKNTLFFVNFYLFIANFEVFPKKSVFWTYLFIGLTVEDVRNHGRRRRRDTARLTTNEAALESA